ncbi:hypothetical protein CDD82_2432 [Ophiocordyceps australis]|uniref:Alpha box domain-containing protein n=1 Tax=Ophiocordyceps australis TaxID=1399860 RepID=A0A2C5XEE8_9HYPO|nr:hypothetical protein CDD82_2432 [Ophiocordyceps australis]
MEATRAETLRRLSTAHREELLDLLSDEAINQLANRWEQTQTKIAVHNILVVNEATTVENLVQGTNSDRAKRPVNGYMAFRSYYRKIFPGVEQKFVSGFITILWHKDPFPNKWALIAKVYSFVRDQVGKSNATLSRFLEKACPQMQIIEPADYLDALGWSVHVNENGSLQLVRDESFANRYHSENEPSKAAPSTEMDLFKSILDSEFLNGMGAILLEKLSSNPNAVMAIRDANLGSDMAMDQFELIDNLNAQSGQPVREVPAEGFDNERIDDGGAQTHHVANVDSILHLDMQQEYSDPVNSYDFGTSLYDFPFTDPSYNLFPCQNLFGIETYDVRDPSDFDRFMGYTQTEGEKSANLPPSRIYSPYEDFYRPI